MWVSVGKEFICTFLTASVVSAVSPPLTSRMDCVHTFEQKNIFQFCFYAVWNDEWWGKVKVKVPAIITFQRTWILRQLSMLLFRSMSTQSLWTHLPRVVSVGQFVSLLFCSSRKEMCKWLFNKVAFRSTGKASHTWRVIEIPASPVSSWKDESWMNDLAWQIKLLPFSIALTFMPFSIACSFDCRVLSFALVKKWNGNSCEAERGVFCANNSVLTQVLNAGHTRHTLVRQHIYELTSFFLGDIVASNTGNETAQTPWRWPAATSACGNSQFEQICD